MDQENMSQNQASTDTTSPLDGAISMVKRFMTKPPTPQDLEHLLTELESCKSYMTDEEEPEVVKPESGLMSKPDVEEGE